MNEAAIDGAGPVRPGEELDAAALQAYVEARGLARGPLRVSQFPRGFSNLTYLVEAAGEGWVLRRPPAGVGKGVAHDVVREARLLQALGSAYPRVPRIVAICDDPAVIGAPFYLMSRAVGIILRDRPPASWGADPDRARQVSRAAVATLAEIHAVDYRSAGLEGLGRPEGYVERQVSGWCRRYEAARTGPQPALERVADWLAAHRPPDGGAALVHNDFKYDNLVLDPVEPARVVAVLDWEMATIGDPLLDLGTTLAYWVEPDDPPALRALGLGVTTLPGTLTREEVVAEYAARTGRPVRHAVFAYAFGLYKVAVIVQQIYARYVAGHTRDPRFASFDQVVTALADAGERAIARDRVAP
jgi:aminoglycoside phosphotransferase (APT) family kinase protein